MKDIQRILSYMRRAIDDHGMIREGDRIAVGISGAVRHTCAIENAGTVIAINPDKDAPVFDSADYGILANFEEIEF